MLHLEALWALNSWVDCCVLWMVGRLINQPPKWRRFLFLTSTSTLMQAGFMNFDIPQVIEILSFLLFSFFIVWYSFSIKGFRSLLRACITFWGASSLIGGGMYMIKQMLRDSKHALLTENSFSMLVILSLLLITAMVCMTKIVESLQMNHIGETFTYQVEIEVNGQAWRGNGFLDSGNHVIDPFTKSPVVFANAQVAKELLPDMISSSLTGQQFMDWPTMWQKKVRMIPSRTVHSTNQMMIGIMCDRVACTVNGKKFLLNNVPVVFTNETLLFEEKCNCLLNPLQLLPCHQL
ncbi:sigma-E processing peptidase SpoIIGA [Jeotgalibacillus proteolyticus]|uniref:Sporulation sigma-E factor-processing peptidase n=1 Tax=Jeotgalibacillus proteolyticus TaxID=2082395 RepID=A0A2S5GGL3_9BACL|nr:sigma-E processing peptidase SpoIIGA [Jeotgalibacillus proteolyticus]PPA72129.1 hypothetical protein C4B60_01755 [Jeotgalibacillus proteolyticus]